MTPILEPALFDSTLRRGGRPSTTERFQRRSQTPSAPLVSSPLAIPVGPDRGPWWEKGAPRVHRKDRLGKFLAKKQLARNRSAIIYTDDDCKVAHNGSKRTN
jgi:hypothetical protein